MESLLNSITHSIQTFKSLDEIVGKEDGQLLTNIMKNLSSDLFFLEKHRDEYARKHNTILHLKISEGMAVSKAEIIAKEQVPELYLLRRIMTSAYKTLDAVRSTLSFVKSEQS